MHKPPPKSRRRDACRSGCIFGGDDEGQHHLARERMKRALADSGELWRTLAKCGERRRTPANPAEPCRAHGEPMANSGWWDSGLREKAVEQEVCVAPKHPSTHQSSPEGRRMVGIVDSVKLGFRVETTLPHSRFANRSAIPQQLFFFFSQLAVPACYVCRVLTQSSQHTLDQFRHTTLTRQHIQHTPQQIHHTAHTQRHHTQRHNTETRTSFPHSVVFMVIQGSFLAIPRKAADAHPALKQEVLCAFFFTGGGGGRGDDGRWWWWWSGVVVVWCCVRAVCCGGGEVRWWWCVWVGWRGEGCLWVDFTSD